MSVVRLQAVHLFWLLLHMKRWKSLWVIAVFFSLISNHIFFPIVDSMLGTMGQTYVDVGAGEFVSNNILLADTKSDSDQLNSVMSMLDLEKVDTSSLIEHCSGSLECETKMFSVMYGRIDTSRFTNNIAYRPNGSNVPNIRCQMAHGAELHCPYLGNLAGMSQHAASNTYRFKAIKFFSLTSRKEGKKVDSQRGVNTMCAKHENFEAVYAHTIMLQCMFITGSVAFYFLASTQACIAELKREGFLQLMHQKGLSVLAYWLVIGGITAAEVLTFAMILIISLAVQCPGFFNALHMMAVFFMALFYLLSLTATGLLFTVTLGSYFYVGLLTVLIAILSMVLISINRLVLSTTIWLKFTLLFVFPLGHYGEFVQGVMLAEIRSQSVGAYNIAILLMTLLLALVLACAILLLDFTHPAGNGFCLPKDFFLRREFWSEPRPVSENERDDPLYGREPAPCANVEPVTDSLKPMVRLCELSKTYESRRLCSQVTRVTAIKDMSALIYENHITAIIGHNGAGKTTLLNLLTGAEVPTTGSVSICGVLASCPLNRLQLRNKLGICPQALSFASSLTVEQTIRLTVVSCGFEWEECQEEVQDVLHILRMDNKLGQVLGPMSAGQQRKLAVAMAFLGDPKVLFLDEPTSGLDPESRRRMWKLLQTYRLGRSIILSTQFMDEADTLADRKIFLSGGSLICAGSSLFLKSAFDCGFVFEVTLKNEKHAQLLRRQICDDFKSVKAKNRFGNNINFHLPAKDIDFLPALAQSLEKRMELISAFGLLQASLYDIFMRLKDLDEKAVEALFNEDRIGQLTLTEVESEVESEAEAERRTRLSSVNCIRNSGLQPSLLRQLRAMIVVNVTRMMRTPVRLACRAAVPAVLLIILLASAFVEKGFANHGLHLWTNMTNDGESFSYGVCVFDDIPTNAFSIVDGTRCGEFFKGKTAKTRPNPLRYLPLKKDRAISLAEFLQQKENVNKIEKLCKSKSSMDPCPIVYAKEWYETDMTNPERSIYVGSYSTYEKFNSSTSASVSMAVFQKAANFFTNTNPSKISFFFTAVIVYDFRSTVVPTLGTFFQLLILAFIPATFLDDIIEDKETRVRYQLASMGMGCISYWLTNFIIHWLQYSVIYSLTALSLVAIVQTGYSSAYYMVGIFLPTLLCGLPSNQLLAYLLSTIMDRSNHLVTIMCLFFSVFLSMIIQLVQLNNVLAVIMIALVPMFASVALTFYGVKTIFYTLSYHGKTSLSDISGLAGDFFFSQPHVMAAFLALILHTILMLAMLVLIENRLILSEMFESHFRSNVVQEHEEIGEDPGVQEEMERVNENPRCEDNLMEVRHLRKTYPNGTRVVRDVTFATGPAEIFGLLGPNGAGKTTTLSMIVGHLKTSGGRCEVRYKDTWLHSGLAASKGAIGYCPQHDPLYNCMSSKEHLLFYATVLGVPQESMQTHIDALVEGLNLDTTPGKLAGQLSVGNRRRLSLAISLLGEPAVIVIDEATTGVDPEGKRFLWQAIRTAANANCTVIITTHSMEEVEAICNKVTVINRGLMVGLGTVQQLRTRYGRSYSLEILISTTIGEDPEDVQMKKNALIAAVTKKFPNTVIIEEFNDRVHFSIPVAAIGRLSAALSWLIDNKSMLKIHYFSFHQMSMDQVFERMVKQHEKQVKTQRRASMFSMSSIASDAVSVV